MISKTKDEFSLFEVRDKLGITRNRLQEWVSMGFITPKEKAAGAGTKNVFDRNNVYQIRLFQIFLKLGVYRKDAKSILIGKIDFSNLKEGGQYCNLRPDRSGTGWSSGRGHSPVELKKGDGVGITIDLEDIKRQVDELM